MPYKTLHDFFTQATAEEKKEIFTEAAMKANEEQRRLVEQVDHIGHTDEMVVDKQENT